MKVLKIVKYKILLEFQVKYCRQCFLRMYIESQFSKVTKNILKNVSLIFIQQLH
jgi:hypothetical protein